MSTADRQTNVSPAAVRSGAAGEGGAPNAADDAFDERTIELATSELQIEPAPAAVAADEIGPTVVGIPIRNQLAAARIAHVLGNAREAQALIDEAVELLATVRGLHSETYQLGAARGALRDTVDLLARHARAAREGGVSRASADFDLKNDPTYDEISFWVSFGIPVMS